MLGLFPIGPLVFLLFLAIGACSSAFSTWMLVDCIKNERLSSTGKIVWLLMIVLLRVFGALIYSLAGRNKTIA